ncbi:MAG TPA: hypothetical protein VFX60_17770, partial [Micromonospora sp.]|nr:hypothetical protein [Micromonospora sp.]
VLVELLARADVGDLDDQAAGQAFKQAEKVVAALDQPHQWPLFQAMIARVDADPRAAAIVEDLRSAARHEQHGADLVKALQEAMEVATALLAEIQPKPPTVVVKPPENERKPQGGDADDEPERSRSEQKPSGGGSGQIVAPPAPEDKVLPPIDPRLIPPQQRQVTTAEEWQAVADEIRGLIANGKRVNLTWTAQ